MSRTSKNHLTRLARLLICLTFGAIPWAQAQGIRDYVKIVGSSTVFPFSTSVAERVGQAGHGKTPTVESTGTGGGFKLFCAGVGVGTPDIVNASRRMKPSEFEECETNGVAEILEVAIGFDGIALVTGKDGPDLDLDLRDIYLALAMDVPSENGDLVSNPYQTWNEVSALLPDSPISVSGPSPIHGTREAFEELAMEGGCRSIESLALLETTDKPTFLEACRTLREDGRFVAFSGSYNLAVEKVKSDPGLVGVIGFNYLDQNRNILKAIPIEGIEPTFDAIAEGDYPIARSIYFYVKLQHWGIVDGLSDYVEAFISDQASGEEGYLEDRGLIPLSPTLRDAVHRRVDAKEQLTVDDLI